MQLCTSSVSYWRNYSPLLPYVNTSLGNPGVDQIVASVVFLIIVCLFCIISFVTSQRNASTWCPVTTHIEYCYGFIRNHWYHVTFLCTRVATRLIWCGTCIYLILIYLNSSTRVVLWIAFELTLFTPNCSFMGHSCDIKLLSAAVYSLHYQKVCRLSWIDPFK